jgi:quercetin dioxygenase-like cupin family protein
VSRPQHFSFARTRLAPSVAHDGRGTVEAARVLTGNAPGVGFVDLVVVPPGCSIGRHTHGADEEVYVVVDGTGEMVVDGTPLTVRPGDVVVNAPGGTHELANTSDAPLRLVVVDVACSGRA